MSVRFNSIAQGGSVVVLFVAVLSTAFADFGQGLADPGLEPFLTLMSFQKAIMSVTLRGRRW